MKKLPFIVLFFGLCVGSLFADSQLLLQTKYFDIIYSAPSEVSARLLYEHADGYADEICAELHREAPERMPVYLVSDTEYLNGYFMNEAYRKIVINDTATEAGVLENFDTTVLTVFYHELTHALTLDLGSILFPMSLKEGVAVLLESSDGVIGRLYDPLVMHDLIQNKIDGSFPTYTEASGLRDMYPQGSWPYFYGGAFSAYLQKVYGEEKFAEFWKGSWRLFPGHAFKAVFGVPIDYAWADFISTIPIPAELKKTQPLDSRLNAGGYARLAAFGDTLAYHDFNEGSVYLFNPAGGKKRIIKTADSVNAVNFSPSGHLLAVSDSMLSAHTTMMNRGTHRTRVFSIQDNRFLNEQYDSVRQAAFIDDDRLTGVRVKKAGAVELVVIDRSAGTVTPLLSAGPENAYTALYNPVYAGNNRVAVIAARALKRDILFVPLDGGEIETLMLDDEIQAVRFLQAADVDGSRVLTFGWAGKDMLYRAAEYNINEKKLRIQTADVLGGSFYPVLYNGKMTVVSRYRDYTELSTVDAGYFADSSAAVSAAGTVEGLSAPPTPLFTKDAPNAVSYNPLALKWMWIPKISPLFAMAKRLSEIGEYGIGVDLSVEDPTEMVFAGLGALFYFHPFFAEITARVGARFDGCTVWVEGHDALESYETVRVRKTGFTLNALYTAPLGHIGQSISFGYDAGVNWAGIGYTRSTKPVLWQPYPQNILRLYKAPLTDTVFSQTARLDFADVRHTRVATRKLFARDTYGVRYGLKAGHSYLVEKKQHAGFAVTRLEGATPVVPLKLGVSGYFGYNAVMQPGTGSLFLFGTDWLAQSKSEGYVAPMRGYSSSALGKASTTQPLSGGVGFDATVTLFSYEIQDTLNFVPVIVRRFKLNAGYAGFIQFFGNTNGSWTVGKYLHSAHVEALIAVLGMDIGARIDMPLTGKFTVTPSFYMSKEF